MFKTKRRKELERKEDELYILKAQISDMRHWCAFDSPEIGFAMVHLQEPKLSVSCFRDKLRAGQFTFTNYKCI